MPRHVVILILGLFVAVIPFLGVPGAWKTGGLVTLGLVIAWIALLMVAQDYVEQEVSAEQATLFESDLSSSTNETSYDTSVHTAHAEETPEDAYTHDE